MVCRSSQTKRASEKSHRGMLNSFASFLTSDPFMSSVRIHRSLTADGADISLSTTKKRPSTQQVSPTQSLGTARWYAIKTNQCLEFCQKLIGDNDTFDEVIFSNESSVQTHQNKTNHYRDRLCTNRFREAETPTQSPRLGCHQQKWCVQTNHI